MTRCGLTGGIGSGKSLVCDVFSKLGIPVFHSDDEAKLLYELSEVKLEIRESFGKPVFVQGRVDFKALAGLVFGNDAALKTLNQIIHPRVNARYHAWLQNLKNPEASIMESALIFEAGLDEQFDVVIDVYAPRDICLSRIQKRDGASTEEAERRLHAQMDPEVKRKRSDMVIVNDERSLLLPQVIDVFKKITGKI